MGQTRPNSGKFLESVGQYSPFKPLTCSCFWQVVKCILGKPRPPKANGNKAPTCTNLKHHNHRKVQQDLLQLNGISHQLVVCGIEMDLQADTSGSRLGFDQTECFT